MTGVKGRMDRLVLGCAWRATAEFVGGVLGYWPCRRRHATAVVDIVSRDNKQSDNRDDYFGRFLAAPLSCDAEASSVDRQHHT